MDNNRHLLAIPSTFNRALLACLIAMSPGLASSTTIVGNPNLRVEIAEPNEVNIKLAEAEVDWIDLLHCSTGFTRVTVGQELDLLGSSVPVPEGTFCGVRIAFGGDLHIVANDLGDPDVSIVLEVAAVNMSYSFEIDDGNGTLELVATLSTTDWLTASLLASVYPAGTIDSSHPDHDDLVDELKSTSSLSAD